MELEVREGVKPGTQIGLVPLRPGYRYTLNERNAWFAFDPADGSVHTRGPLDREALAQQWPGRPHHSRFPPRKAQLLPQRRHQR